jgi:hypothetical protein
MNVYPWTAERDPSGGPIGTKKIGSFERIECF